MRLVFLTFHYPPDLGAGSFRAEPLCEALERRLPPEWSIDIYTTAPNRYRSYRQAAPPVETQGRITVHRIELPKHASGMVDQSWAFGAYARGVLCRMRGKRFDAVLATSSRLLTAALGARIARANNVPLYLDIRDIFVDTMHSLLPRSASLALIPGLNCLERYTLNTAAGVNLVSGGFRDYFEARFPNLRFKFVPNGIDDEFMSSIKPSTAAEAGSESATSNRTILYAGNIGMGQGLHRILPDLAQRLPEWRFQLIGDGGAAPRIRKEVEERGLDNIELIEPVERSALRRYYASADILFLHLNDVPAFRRVLPSKLFEYAAVGKPILAGLAGFSADFVQREIENAAVFAPCDVEGAVAAMDNLVLETRSRTEFVRRYRRTELMENLAEDIARHLPRARAS